LKGGGTSLEGMRVKEVWKNWVWKGGKKEDGAGGGAGGEDIWESDLRVHYTPLGRGVGKAQCIDKWEEEGGRKSGKSAGGWVRV